MGSIEQQVWRLELSLLTAEIRAQPERVSALLAEDFLEFGRSGAVCRKAETIAALAEEARPSDWRIEATDGEVKILSADFALATYRTARRLPDGSIDRKALRSSIWRLVDGRWLLTFHQGAPAA